MLLSALGFVPTGCSDPEGTRRIAVTLEVRVNSRDGCTACGCRTGAELRSGAGRPWWVAFGEVTPTGSGDWRALGAASRCAAGRYGEIRSEFEENVGIPFLVLDLLTTASFSPEPATLELAGEVRNLSGFDSEGAALYATRPVERRFRFDGIASVGIPLLIPEPRDAEAFALHEVILELGARPVESPAEPSHGSIEVSADLPGASILLGGDFVGRVSGARPLLLENVRAGVQELTARDLSGREARREVLVEEGRSVAARLDFLEGSSNADAMDLVPVGHNPQGHVEYRRTRDAALVVRVPGGEFSRGSRDGEGESDEHPQARVHLSGFLIDKTEVTWRQLRLFAEATRSTLPPTPVYGAPDGFPASFVLWEEAEAYCRWVGGRLPSEAEWEKAARGSDGARYSWGDEWQPRCNSISGGLHGPDVVGSYPACVSPYGVVDMPGSMWEWCSDWYQPAYYAEGAPRDPKGPAAGTLRVKRGGAWMSQPSWLRAAYRAKASPHSRNVDHGFRCAHDAPE